MAKQRNKQIPRQEQTNKQTNKQTPRQKQTNKQTNTHTKQINKQTNTQRKTKTIIGTSWATLTYLNINTLSAENNQNK